jgi:hypothetical protein
VEAGRLLRERCEGRDGPALLLVAPELGKLRTFPIIDLYATQLDNLVGQAAYDRAIAEGIELSEAEWDEVFDDASKRARLGFLDEWKAKTLR